ncbi:hypothetical protein BJ170DRAFT_183062 [Xylariales sp. AK1849]|nr:hypothetical protein BJ170DRAFT_183062 [Xylariales sp. AK1849]
MLSAVESLLEKHPEVRPQNLGIWVDYSCVNQDDPLSGVQALPMMIMQCDAMISLVDEDYYSRAWCSVEVMLMQTIKKTYGLYLWYEQVATSRRQEATGLRHNYVLREGNIDLQLVLAEKHLSLETDRQKIYFLERQIKLLR